MENKIYISKDYFLFFVTQEYAQSANNIASMVHFQNLVDAKRHAYIWTGSAAERKVAYSKPEDAILLLKKEPGYDNAECWNVLIGEKIGWIVLRKGLVLKELSCEK